MRVKLPLMPILTSVEKVHLEQDIDEWKIQLRLTFIFYMYMCMFLDMIVHTMLHLQQPCCIEMHIKEIKFLHRLCTL